MPSPQLIGLLFKHLYIYTHTHTHTHTHTYSVRNKEKGEKKTAEKLENRWMNGYWSSGLDLRRLNLNWSWETWEVSDLGWIKSSRLRVESTKCPWKMDERGARI